MFKPLSPVTTVVVFFCANLCYCFAYLVRDIFWLRVLTIIAALLTFPYFFFQQNTMYSALFWQSAFVIINLANIALLLHARRPVPLTEDQASLKDMVFRHLSSRETAVLLGKAKWQHAKADQVLMNEGEALDKLYLLYAGNLKIDRGGQTLAHRGPGSFIGEIAYMTGSTSSADVIFAVPSRYIEWDVAELRQLLDKKSELRSAFESLLAVNVAHKLASEDNT